MDTQSSPYLAPQPDSGEHTPSTSSPVESTTPLSSLSLVSTPASSIFELPKQVQRFPHDCPVFEKGTLINPGEPILYLPPFLSTLPTELAHAPSEKISPVGRTTKPTEAHLPDIDTVSLSLHKALHNWGPVTEDYATVPYAEAFNWDELDLPEEDEHEWYCVVFRSARKLGSETSLVAEADRAAHEEAVQNGGLLLYWYGMPERGTGRNLATCIWQSRAHALAANKGPNHIRALRVAVISYETFQLERYTLRKTAGSRRLEVLPFVSSEPKP